MNKKYRLRFFFEWGCGSCLWADNDTARKKFGIGDIALEDVPLSLATIQKIRQLAAWHDSALNWEYPPDPGPWRQEECDRFNAAVKELFAMLQAELGHSYELVNRQPELEEDPDLDEYLRDPKGFKRP